MELMVKVTLVDGSVLEGSVCRLQYERVVEGEVDWVSVRLSDSFFRVVRLVRVDSFLLVGA